MNINKIRIIKKHTNNCYVKIDKKYPDKFHWVFERAYFGSHTGNENVKRGRHHRWLEFICNDPYCEAKIIISENYISQLLVKKENNYASNKKQTRK